MPMLQIPKLVPLKQIMAFEGWKTDETDVCIPQVYQSTLLCTGLDRSMGGKAMKLQVKPSVPVKCHKHYVQFLIIAK